MSELRTKETALKYQLFKENGGLKGRCKICQIETVKEFKYWRVVKNDFPYDLIATKHDMLVLKRHIKENGLTGEERKELEELKEGYLTDNYDFLIEALGHKKSIPKHFHLHLVITK